MRYIISGGGTGGHIYPALSLVEEIQKQDLEAEILYVGTPKGLEKKLAEEKGIAYYGISVQGFRRKFSIETLKTVFVLIKGIFGAFSVMRSFKPDVVIGTGGYVSGPIVMMGTFFPGVFTAIQEQNAYPGVTNRILSRRVNLVFTAFEESHKWLKRAREIRLVGNPVRKAFYDVSEKKSKEFHVLSFGGSGGQTSLNKAVLELLQETKINFIWTHATGVRHYEAFISEIDNLPDQVQVRAYLPEIFDDMVDADLVVTGAGAITIAELQALGKASILIPKAYTTEYHQFFNAKAMVDAGASLMCEEKDLTGQWLMDAVEKLRSDSDLRKKMASQSREMSNPLVTQEIFQLIWERVKHGE
ncbi:undecaprenyldiphospho-muramoylpentapeptide beta-N-acetylglucosaminyltransferase [Gottschalkiaceae bacterium SANA]|nr:undecaprenyldiphospho-muramoylpentapeptide beta-N-acetylglucosaminyltransferase [Gottschalkiaceae bacterium SANA]